jgi:EpsD family peptidyl-prolyl cis-trans isomerase
MLIAGAGQVAGLSSSNKLDVSMFKIFPTFPLVLVSILLIVACGERPAAKLSASQVAAKVNGDEISVHQINFVLQRTQSIPVEHAEAVKRQILEGLIDQELIVQQALESKIDRTPDVALALDNARRDVLVRAYLDQLGGNKSKPSADEARKFYVENPDLFSNRKLYRLQEINFAAKGPALDRVKEQLTQGIPTEEVVSQLKANGVEVTGGASVKSAEQLPLDVLPKIAQAKAGQPLLLENAERASIVIVLASRPEPLDETKALPVIEKFLANKQKSDLARDTLKNLHDKGKIEYMGEFATSKQTAASGKPAGAPGKVDIPKGLGGLN